jgi:hypothetical protein
MLTTHAEVVCYEWRTPSPSYYLVIKHPNSASASWSTSKLSIVLTCAKHWRYKYYKPMAWERDLNLWNVL